MRNSALIIAAALALAACGTTTTTHVSSPYAKPAGAPGYVTYVPAGTVMEVALAEQLSGRDVDPGDRFVAHVAQPVLGAEGELAIPAGTPVLGHVTSIHEASGQYPAAMELSIDAIDLEAGTVPLTAHVVDSHVTTNATDIEGSDVGIGAAIGAVVGTIIDPGEGTLAGAGIGAGGGALVSMGRSADEAILPAGTVLILRLEEPIPVEMY